MHAQGPCLECLPPRSICAMENSSTLWLKIYLRLLLRSWLDRVDLGVPVSQSWWCNSVTPALGKKRQERLVKVSLGYVVRSKDNNNDDSSSNKSISQFFFWPSDQRWYKGASWISIAQTLGLPAVMCLQVGCAAEGISLPRTREKNIVTKTRADVGTKKILDSS